MTQPARARPTIDRARDSFEQVAAAFGGYTAVPGTQRALGRVRQSQQPRKYSRDGQSVKLLTDYHVRSEFTDEQNGYIAVCMGGLLKLVHGKLLVSGPVKTPPRSFSEHVQSHFLGEGEEHMKFFQSVGSAAVDLFDDFGIYHPNLMPALKAMSSAAGIDGMQLAIYETSRFLTFTIDDRSIPRSDAAASATRERFTGVHPGPTLWSQAGGTVHEIWCSGQAVATGIISAAADAATTLAAIPAVRQHYDNIADLEGMVSAGASMRERFTESIDQSLERARMAQ